MRLTTDARGRAGVEPPARGVRASLVTLVVPFAIGLAAPEPRGALAQDGGARPPDRLPPSTRASVAAPAVDPAVAPVLAPVRDPDPALQPVIPTPGEAAAQPPLTPALPRQSVTPGRAAPDGAASAQAESRLAEQLEGLILDATVTPRGRDFFRAFVDAWRLLDARTRYTVTLRELPSPRQGSIVSVEFRGRPLLRSALSPNRAVSAEQSAQFARTAYDAVLEHEAERLLFRSPDLAPEEL